MEALESIGKIFYDTFRFPPINKANDSTSNDFKRKRDALKQELLGICRQLPSSSSKTTTRPTIRLKVEEIIQHLSPLSPVMNTAKSPLLHKEWLLLVVLLVYSPIPLFPHHVHPSILHHCSLPISLSLSLSLFFLFDTIWRRVWTTEKEINFFQDVKLSKCITQTISYTSNDDGRLENLIQFVNGGFLSVEGVLSVDDPKDDSGISIKSINQRTNFQFTSAKLNFGWGGRTFTIPPVGSGWFDTIYLDDDLRIDINSRDDILICTPSTIGL